MKEASDIVLYIAAFFGVAFIPVFLWNLWLAPYRIMGERLERAVEQWGLGQNAVQREARSVDVSTWDGTDVFPLYEAACLWVEVEPHDPITDIRAKAVNSRLRGAILSGKLKCEVKGHIQLTAAISDGDWWPKPNQRVSATDLRAYADQLGDVPLFLQSVELPK